MKLEIQSARDKFWLHPLVRLRTDTTPAQIRTIAASIRELLDKSGTVATRSVRVRFVGFGAFSLDLDVFAYVFARDVNEFLEIQEELLFDIITILRNAGTEMAFQGQAQSKPFAVAN